MENSASNVNANATTAQGITNEAFSHYDSNLSISSSKGSKQGSTLSRRLSTVISSHAEQSFNEQEKKVMATYSSVNYAPTHSRAYMEWLRKHPQRRLQWDRWLLVIIIGIVIGLWAFLLKQCLEALDRLKWNAAKEFQVEQDLWAAWGWVYGIGTIYIIFGSVLVAFVHPPAAGGGVPETVSFLNGIIIHGTLTFKNLIVKFAANVLAVSSGLPCAIQGPIIQMGAIIGNGIGQFQSRTFGCKPNWFSRFRNAEDRRSFTTVGVAAGVAAAFNAPIGGLLYAMEDLSSFWGRRLSWQTFFCCGIASSTASLFNHAFTGFRYDGGFGLLSQGLTEPLQIHILVFIPCIVLGFIGGCLGALFTQLNVFIVGCRKKLLAKISSPTGKKCVRVTETMLLVLIMASIAIWLPSGFPCEEKVVTAESIRGLQQCYYWYRNGTQVTLNPYDCPAGPPPNEHNTTYVYNEVATLLQGSGLRFYETLITRGTHRMFSYSVMLSVLILWFFMTAWTCGTAHAGGIFIPILISGALYGRSIGLGMVDIYEAITGDPVPVDTGDWDWIDPGLIAIIGAGSLLGGVTRLTVAVTVIVVEMSHDIGLIVPILVAIFIAKITADMLSKPLYKYQLEGKSLPYLDPEPAVVVDDHAVNLELHQVAEVMHSPVYTLHATESIAELAKLLLETDHCGFPVIMYDNETKGEITYGLITRMELYVILCSEEVYTQDQNGTIIAPNVDYDELSVDYIPDESAARERIKMYNKFILYNSIFVDLGRYINRSPPIVPQEYSLQRTYMLFRTLGLRHLVVTDLRNRTVGIVTRKDLMAFNIVDKISGPSSAQSWSVNGNYLTETPAQITTISDQLDSSQRTSVADLNLINLSCNPQCDTSL